MSDDNRTRIDLAHINTASKAALATIDPQTAPFNFMYCKERRAHFTAQDIPLDAVLTDKRITRSINSKHIIINIL